MTDLMLDLETLSTRHDAAIVSIGAVVFNTDGTLSDLSKRFYQAVRPSSDPRAHMSVDTVAWWMDQSDAARAVFKDPKAVYLTNALIKFREFIQEHTPAGDKAYVWGCGANFDNSILLSAYERLAVSIEGVWNYKNNRCFRTLKGLRPDVQMPELLAVRDGRTLRNLVAHNALDDAIKQAHHAEHIFHVIIQDRLTVSVTHKFENCGSKT